LTIIKKVRDGKIISSFILLLRNLKSTSFSKYNAINRISVYTDLFEHLKNTFDIDHKGKCVIVPCPKIFHIGSRKKDKNNV